MKRLSTIFFFATVFCLTSIISIAQSNPKKLKIADELFSKGIVAAQNGNYHKAKEYYEAVIDVNPDYVETYQKSGDSKLELKDYKAAIVAYDKVIQICSAWEAEQKANGTRGIIQRDLSCSDRISAYYNRGIAKEGFGDMVGACEDFSVVPKFTDSVFTDPMREKYIQKLFPLLKSKRERVCRNKVSSDNQQQKRSETPLQNFTYLDERLNPAFSSKYTYKRTVQYKTAIIKENFTRDYNYGDYVYGAKPSGLHICTEKIYYKAGGIALIADFISGDFDCSTFGGHHGQLTTYYENGNVQFTVNYEFGKKQGTLINYNENGTEKSREKYDKGKRIDR